MINSRQKPYVRLLIACVTALLLLILVITFSNDARIPRWQDIFGINTLDEDSDFVRFIDVGQGDSVLIYSNGYTAMVDFGDNTDDGANLLKDLKRYGIKHLDCMIVTHYDADHIGGADTVLEQIPVYNIILPKHNTENSRAYRELDTAVKSCSGNVFEAEVGTVITIGEFELTIVGYYEDESTSNDRSVIVMAEMDGVKFLLTGDIGDSIEEQLIEDRLLLDCDVFKAAHHGSRESNSHKFLEYITPAYVAVSCGELNSYGHPHDEATANFNKVNAKVFRTDVDGDITFFVKNGVAVPSLEYVK